MKVLCGNCKSPTHSQSEDVVGHNNGFCWLLDGATPPIPELNHKLTFQFVQSVNEKLEQITNNCNSIDEVLDQLSTLTQQGNKGYSPYSTLILTCLRENEIEYFVLSDSTLGIQSGEKMQVFRDDSLESVAVKEREHVKELVKLGVSESSEEYKEARALLVRTELELQNKDGGYWVFNGKTDVREKALRGRLKLQDGFTVILASDGLCRLCNLSEEFKDVFEIANCAVKEGDQIFTKLRSLEQENVGVFSSVSDDASFVVMTDRL